MQTKKFSEWCDKIKDNHKFCVDEEMTREQFVTQLAISHFLNLRGCSWLIAAGYAADHFKKEYDKAGFEVSGRVSELPDNLLNVHAICDQRDRLRVDNAELLGALEKMIELREVHERVHRGTDATVNALAEARQAIAKAKGQI